MKHLVKFTFGMAAAILLLAANMSAITIADWTYEVSYTGFGNNNYYYQIGPLAPEVGSGAFRGVHAGILSMWSNNPGNGSVRGIKVNNWAVGDYFQFQVDLTGYGDVTLDWDQAGGLSISPRDFALQYSTDNSTYTTFASYTVRSNYPVWTATSYLSEYHYSFDLSSVSEIENASTAYFRLVNTSATSINGGTVGTSGASYIDNFQVSAEVIPEPSTMILVGIGLVGCVVAGRRRHS